MAKNSIQTFGDLLGKARGYADRHIEAFINNIINQLYADRMTIGRAADTQRYMQQQNAIDIANGRIPRY